MPLVLCWNISQFLYRNLCLSSNHTKYLYTTHESSYNFMFHAKHCSFSAGSWTKQKLELWWSMYTSSLICWSQTLTYHQNFNQTAANSQSCACIYSDADSHLIWGLCGLLHSFDLHYILSDSLFCKCQISNQNFCRNADVFGPVCHYSTNWR